MQNPPVPWLSVAKSVPVWAVVIMSFCSNWGLYTLLTDLPTYLNDVLQYSISKVC
jgi:hypothetical protein